MLKTVRGAAIINYRWTP